MKSPPQAALRKPKPPLGVVIVNHNLKASLRETLQSVRKVHYPSVTVVVSDNASSDGAPEMVRQEFPAKANWPCGRCWRAPSNRVRA